MHAEEAGTKAPAKSGEAACWQFGFGGQKLIFLKAYFCYF